MKISKRDLSLLFAVVGILIAVLVYVNVFLSYSDKKIALESEITALDSRLTLLNGYKENLDTYQSGISDMTVEENQIIDEFPADIKPENEIMFAKNLEGWASMTIPTVSFGSPTTIASVGAQVAADGSVSTTDAAATTETASTETADTETAEAPAATTEAVASTNTKNVYLIPVGISYQTTYQGMKDAINYIGNQQSRMVVDSLAATYDNTSGDLSGTMTINMYSMDGTDKSYEEPVVGHISIGTDNIFNTITGTLEGDSETDDTSSATGNSKTASKKSN